MLGFIGLFSSATEAARSGYDSTVSVEDVAPIDIYRDSLTDDEQARFDSARFGDTAKTVQVQLVNGATAAKSTGGCEGKAASEIYGSVRDQLRVEVAQNNVLFLASNPDVTKALDSHLDQYEDCMRRAGVAVTGLHMPELAKSRFGAYREEQDPPSPDEAELAQSDASCQQDAGLDKAVTTAFYVSANDWLRQNEREFHEVASIVRTAQLNAEMVAR